MTNRLPPIGEGCVRFAASDSSIHDVPERWLAEAYTIDPDLRLVPGPDANVLVLTAEDRAFLWSYRIDKFLNTSEPRDSGPALIAILNKLVLLRFA